MRRLEGAVLQGTCQSPAALWTLSVRSEAVSGATQFALVSGDLIDLRAFWRIAGKRSSAIRRPGLVSYNERRKFKISCTCDRLRLLKLRRTPLASEP